MIRNILELLQALDFYNENERIHFAKGSYRYPRNIKELFTTAKRWFKFKK